MWKRMLVSVVLGTLGLFFSGLLFWVVLPHSFSHPILSKTLSPTYSLSSPTASFWFATLFGQVEPTSMMWLCVGLLQHFISALLMSVLVAWLVVRKRLASLEARFFFVVLVGTLAATGIELLGPMFMNRPWHPHLYNAVAQLGSWMLVAVPVAGVLRLRPQEVMKDLAALHPLPVFTRTAILNSKAGSPTDWLRAACATPSPYKSKTSTNQSKIKQSFPSTPSRECVLQEPPLPKLSLPAL